MTRYTRQRIAYLSERLKEESGAPIAPPTPTDKRDYRQLSESGRENGLWYFEVTIDAMSIATNPTDVWYGCRREHFYAGALAQARGSGGLAFQYHGGVALDLNAGKVYVRGDNGWIDGAPGSSGGMAVKLGETYRCGVETTVLVHPLIDQGSVQINYGDQKFFYSMPEGYHPFSDGGK